MWKEVADADIARALGWKQCPSTGRWWHSKMNPYANTLSRPPTLRVALAVQRRPDA